MTKIPNFTLSNGTKVPAVGLGTFSFTTDGAFDAVKKGLELGYRHLDAAWFYPTQPAVGEALVASGVPRDEVFVTTKVWCTHTRPDLVGASLERSLEQLCTPYVDLFMLHWPWTFAQQEKTSPASIELALPIVDGRLAVKLDMNLVIDAYHALEKLIDEGKTRAIGLSNFSPKLIDQILKVCKHRPVVNQVECHLWLQQQELLDYCNKENILVTAYTPLGYLSNPEMCKGTEEDMKVLQRIADKYGKSLAQVSISYLVQRGICAIPKTFTPARLAANQETFALEEEDMKALAKLDKGREGRYHGASEYMAVLGDAMPEDLVKEMEDFIWA